MSRQEIKDTGDKEMAQRQHEERSLRFFPRRNGMLGLTGQLPPLNGNRVQAVLEAVMDAAYRDAFPERAAVAGGHNAEPEDRRLADALVGIVLNQRSTAAPDTDNESSTGPSATHEIRATKPTVPAVIVSIRLNDQTASLLGPNGGPIPFSTALAHAATPGAAVYGLVMDNKGDVLWMNADARLANTVKGLAVAIRDVHCVYPGCSRAHTRSEIHHVIEYGDDGPTLVWNLVLLCDAHHHHLHKHKLTVRRTPDGGIEIVDQHGHVFASGAPPPAQVAA